MSKPHGVCIFCGGKGLTKEHLWPKWMRPIIVFNTEGEHKRLRTTLKSIWPTSLVEKKTEDKTLQGSGINWRLRIVCQTCNGGWMSKVEHNTKPVIQGLLDETIRTLDEEQQAKLAFWATVRTAVYERDDPTWAALTPDEYGYIRSEKKPPANWRIWISSQRAPYWQTRFLHCGSVHGNDVTDRKGPNSQKTLLGINGIALLAASSTSSVADRYLVAVTPRQMKQIWPYIGEIGWPTAQCLSDADMMQIAYAVPNVR